MPLPHLKRTLECSTPGTRLSVKYDQLVIKRPDLPTATVPIEEIGMIVVDDGRATLTQGVLASLAESNATVVVTGDNHMPVGIMLPIQGHSAPIPIQRKQIGMSEPRRKQLWKSIVQSKIRQQSLVLQHFNGEDAGISALTKKVLSGDTSNVEAQAAQRYWPKLFGSTFRRNRTLPGINALLNYGYAIVRAAVARASARVGSALSGEAAVQRRTCRPEWSVVRVWPSVVHSIWRRVRHSREGESPSRAVPRRYRPGFLHLLQFTRVRSRGDTPRVC